MASERDASDSMVSRPSVLRYDVSGAGAPLTATQEWNLTADLPSVGANAGTESVEWVPDTYLVAAGFLDQATGAPYDPATYPNHGTGLFFVGLEANGLVYAYALDQTSAGFTRVATFASGFPTFGALHWESETNRLWVVCDNQLQRPQPPLPGRDAAGRDAGLLRPRVGLQPSHRHGQPQQRGLHHHAGQRVRRRQQAGLLG